MNYSSQNLISIITACYNSEKYISDTIDSILSQTYTQWEWLIVDDFSTDSSVAIIESYNDDRIKLIKLSENKGAAIARNYGISEATGRYISFIDSDDLWPPTALEERINYLKENNEAAVYTSYKRLNEKLEPYLNDFIAEDNISFKRLLKNCPVSICTLVYDTEKVGKITFPNVDRREDYAMILNLTKKIKIIRAINKPLFIYRIRDNSYSRNKWLMFKSQFLVYYNFLGLSLYESLYYTIQWAINGLKKYERI